MKRLFITLAAALALAAGAAAQREGDQVVVCGTLTVWNPGKKERSGLPGNHDHDYFLLKPARPFEAEIANWNVGHNGEFEKTALAEIQVWGAGGLDDPALKRLVGKRVVVKGQLQAAITTQHITPLLIDLQDGGTCAQAETSAAQGEIAEGIDRTMENIEASDGPYARRVKAAAYECVETYGKAVANHLKGVYAISRENFEDPAADKWQTSDDDYPWLRALDEYYVCVLYQLNSEGAVSAAVLKKEETRIAIKWGQK